MWIRFYKGILLEGKGNSREGFYLRLSTTMLGKEMLSIEGKGSGESLYATVVKG